MSLADCVDCWSNPCTCKHQWHQYGNREDLYQEIVMIIQHLTVKESFPLQPIVDKIVEKCRQKGIQ